MKNRTRQTIRRILISILISLPFIASIIVCLVYSYNTNQISEVISLVVAIVAIAISILTSYYTICKNEDFEYKKHIINILINRKDTILNIYDNIISAVNSQNDINDSTLAFIFLNIPIFKKKFNEYYFEVSKIIANYGNLKLAQYIEPNDLISCLQDLQYSKMNFENQINDLITKIYKGQISISDIENSNNVKP